MAGFAKRFAIIAMVFAMALPSAYAHVTIDNAQSQRGSFKARFNVTHGCEGSPTHELRITIPEGVIGVKPMPKPGWSVATQSGPYARTYDYFHGKQVAEGIQSVTWSGGKLLNEHFDEFVLGVYITDALKPGETVYFPVQQICERGTLSWVDTPLTSQGATTLKAPAPGIKILAENDRDASPGRTFKAGTLSATDPWANATPGGATIAAGYLTLTNAAQDADRLIGGTFAGAGEVEIHETTTDGGIARMRRLADGLIIGPGQTVEFGPGGLHLMIRGLTSPLTGGSIRSGTLKFASGRQLDLDFIIKTIGNAQTHTGHH